MYWIVIVVYWIVIQSSFTFFTNSSSCSSLQHHLSWHEISSKSSQTALYERPVIFTHTTLRKASCDADLCGKQFGAEKCPLARDCQIDTNTVLNQLSLQTCPFFNQLLFKRPKRKSGLVEFKENSNIVFINNTVNNHK